MRALSGWVQGDGSMQNAGATRAAPALQAGEDYQAPQLVLLSR